MRTTMTELFAKMHGSLKGEPYFGIWLLSKPHLMIRDLNLIKHIFVKDFQNFQNRSIINCEKADSLASKVLFFLRNPEWKLIRQKLTPIFTIAKLKGMFGLMQETGDVLSEKLNEISKRKYFDAKDLSSRFSIDILSTCVYGIKGDSLMNDNDPFYSLGKQLFDFTFFKALRAFSYFFLPIFVRLFRITFFQNGARVFMRNAFWEVIKDRERTKIKRNDLIDVLLELKEKENLTDEIKFGKYFQKKNFHCDF